MIRHAAIAILFLMCLTMFGLQALSFKTAVYIPCSIHFGPDPQELVWDFGEVLDPEDYTERRGLAVLAHDGRLTVRVSTISDEPVDDWDGSFLGLSAAVREGASFYEREDFFMPGTTTYERETGLTLPLWLPIILLGVWPGVALLRFCRMTRRRRRGLCLRCCYDLRGSDGVCPECGTPAEPVAV